MTEAALGALISAAVLLPLIVATAAVIIWELRRPDDEGDE